MSPTPPRTASIDDAKKNIERDSLNELDGIGLKEVLDQDSRPTFVLDLDSDYLDIAAGNKDELDPIFCNAALRLHDRLLDTVTGAAVDEALERLGSTTHQAFRSWAAGVSKFDDSKDVFPLTFIYCGILWTGSTVRKRWRMISGNQCYQVPSVSKRVVPSVTPIEVAEITIPDREATKRRIPASDIPTGSDSNATSQNTLISSARQNASDARGSKRSDSISNDTSSSGVSISINISGRSVPDWTAHKIKGVLTPHTQFARSIDWASTPLGPMTSWSAEFREIANLLMRNPHPAALFWGEELTMLYNESYRVEIAGNKHPALMGTGFSGPFAELWNNVGPIFKECARTGNSVRRENDMLPIERHGYLEETFFAWSFTPVYGGTNRILGFYNAPFETTYQTISSRRMQTLRYLGEKVSPVKAVKQFWKGVLDGLEENPFDIPFALLYSIVDSDEGDSESHSSESMLSSKSCYLEGAIGVPSGHPASPPKLDLHRSREGFIPSFREAMRTREPTKLESRDGTLPEDLLEGINWRGFKEPCREAIIIPVRPTNGENVFAFLLIGINPRRAYDEDYQMFITMLNRQLATSLASVLLFEDEVRRSRNAEEAAALQRDELSQQLELQTSRLRRMTEFSPLGMYLYSPDGVLLEANDRYYEMTAYPRDSQDEKAFLHLVAEGSRQTALDTWRDMTTDFQPRSAELQLNSDKVTAHNLRGEPIEYWVLASSLPEIGIDGQLRSIMGSITDISHIKWVQGLQDQRLREAEETKRQQNEFIDMTSHEMRNPLSAILICADDIRESLSERKFSANDAAIVESCIEAANTIALCVQHQKSIVDDILTVSKLDSNLLLITPIPVQPVVVVKRAMSMFKAEVQAKDFQFNFHPEPSLQTLAVDWVNLDPSRLLQITVNMITNAIKFTQTSLTRRLSLRLGASLERPVMGTNDFQYVPTRNPQTDVTTSEDWGSGELLYITVQVADTGCGLTDEEKQLLFERFAQASPRTHAHYGGSGLGLFISRQLAELHGGQVGVASKSGVGSTFGFFIQSRRVDPPPPAERRPLASPEQVPIRNDKVNTLRPSQPSPVLVNALDSSPSASATTVQTESTKVHVLIVEDNLVNQKVLSKQLIKAGCSVSTADNGLHALRYLETTELRRNGGTPLSIILMDLEMPEMDGLTCVSHIRQMETDGTVTRHIPIIAVTANVRAEQIAKAKDSGMDDVVSKPFRIPDLMNKIEVLLERIPR